MSEFTRIADIRHLTEAPLRLIATEAERAALARRFGIVSIAALEAAVQLTRDGPAVSAAGTLRAEIVQSCAVSGEDLPVTIDEPIALRFVPEAQLKITEEEIELDDDTLDEIPFSGTQFDLGEAVAQSLALAIDPYAEGPEAERVRREVLTAQEASGPFAALAALKKL